MDLGFLEQAQYQQRFEAELAAAQPLRGLGEGRQPVGRLAVGPWLKSPVASFSHALLLPPPPCADEMATAVPGRDYVLRYDSQQAYEALTGKLRMLREWRVRAAFIQHSTKRQQRRARAPQCPGWQTVHRQGTDSAQPGSLTARLCLPRCSHLGLGWARTAATVSLCRSRGSTCLPQPLLPQDGVPRGAYRGTVAIRNPAGARIFLAPTPDVDFSGGPRRPRLPCWPCLPRFPGVPGVAPIKHTHACKACLLPGRRCGLAWPPHWPVAAGLPWRAPAPSQPHSTLRPSPACSRALQPRRQAAGGQHGGGGPQVSEPGMRVAQPRGTVPCPACPALVGAQTPFHVCHSRPLMAVMQAARAEGQRRAAAGGAAGGKQAAAARGAAGGGATAAGGAVPGADRSLPPPDLPAAAPASVLLTT